MTSSDESGDGLEQFTRGYFEEKHNPNKLHYTRQRGEDKATDMRRTLNAEKLENKHTTSNVKNEDT